MIGAIFWGLALLALLLLVGRSWYFADDFKHITVFGKVRTLWQVILDSLRGNAYRVGGDANYRPVNYVGLRVLAQFESPMWGHTIRMLLHLCAGYLVYRLALVHVASRCGRRPQDAGKRPI